MFMTVGPDQHSFPSGHCTRASQLAFLASYVSCNNGFRRCGFLISFGCNYTLGLSMCVLGSLWLSPFFVIHAAACDEFTDSTIWRWLLFQVFADQRICVALGVWAICIGISRVVLGSSTFFFGFFFCVCVCSKCAHATTTAFPANIHDVFIGMQSQSQ